MSNIKSVIKRLVKQGKQIECFLPVTPVSGQKKEFYVPDSEIEKLCEQYPQYGRCGVELFKVEGKRVWLPYYLTKGAFTEKAEMLMPLKVTPIFP